MDDNSLVSDLNASLRAAIYDANFARILELVRRGAHVATRDPYGRTALHTASIHNRLDVIQFLVSIFAGGEQVDAPVIAKGGRPGWTAFQFACAYHHTATAQWLIRSGGAKLDTAMQEWILWHHACKPGRLSLFKLLELTYFQLETMERDGGTILHYASSLNSSELVQYLVQERRVNVHSTNKYGQTALHMASRHHNVDMVQCLVHAGGRALVQFKDHTYTTALDIAIDTHDVLVASCLVESCGGVQAKLFGGNQTVLHRVVRGKHRSLALTLHFVQCWPCGMVERMSTTPKTTRPMSATERVPTKNKNAHYSK